MSYQILGRAVKSEHLALGTLLGSAALAFGLSGKSDNSQGAKSTAAPSSVASSSSREEEDFIKKFIEEAEKESKH